MRFDRRGIGASGGNSKSVTDTDESEDASCALDYLLSRKETDPQRVAVIGHGKGAFFAVKLASERKNVRALILMAPLISQGGETDLNFDNLKEMAAKKVKDGDNADLEGMLSAQAMALNSVFTSSATT